MPREWWRNGCYRLTLQTRIEDDYDGDSDLNFFEKQSQVEKQMVRSLRDTIEKAVANTIINIIILILFIIIRFVMLYGAIWWY